MTKTENVTLSWREMGLAWYVAGQMNLSNKMEKAKARYGAPDNDEMTHVHAMRAELAVAKAFNLFWSGSVGNKDAVDVGGILEVRSSARTGNSRLILHPTDRDDYPYIFADVSAAPTIRLCGWIMGRDGKQQQFWTDPTAAGRPAFFIPQSDLLPMADLHFLVELKRTELMADDEVAA
jgi:hypothetical protein